MANDEHLDLLNQGVEVWNDWRFKTPDVTPDLSDADFSDVDFKVATLSRAKLLRANLSDADLHRANLSDADLHRANLRHASLTGTNFSGATLTDVSLRGAVFDAGTNLKGAAVDGCQVDRYALECLEDYGGLTKGARMNMLIYDDVARLRRAYSGFLQWLHLISLLLFFFPYAWFVITHWAAAKFQEPSDASITLFEALLRYIWNGGRDWDIGWDVEWMSFFSFCILCIYNIIRSLLLYKTKTLEMEEEASGLPAKFTFEDYAIPRFITWQYVYLFASWGMLIYWMFGLYNTFHFFTQRINI